MKVWALFSDLGYDGIGLCDIYSGDPCGILDAFVMGQDRSWKYAAYWLADDGEWQICGSTYMLSYSNDHYFMLEHEVVEA